MIKIYKIKLNEFKHKTGSHCAVSLSKTLNPLNGTGLTQEDRKLSRPNCKIDESFYI